MKQKYCSYCYGHEKFACLGYHIFTSFYDDNNRVTGLHNSYPRVIAVLNVLLELVYL